MKIGRTLSNKNKFSDNFMLISTTTMLIITIVKSSLALSLGLVGALSIVRFRSAIKEPEELAYLFLNIGIGLGMGADQRVITSIGFFIIIILLIAKSKFSHSNPTNLNLIIRGNGEKLPTIGGIIEILEPYCKNIEMIRFDISGKNFDSNFIIDPKDISSMDELNGKLSNKFSNISITYMDYNNLI